MAASKYDFPIEQGSSFKLSLVYKDSDDNVVDLTGWCSRLIWVTNTGTTQVFTTENVNDTSYNFTIDGTNGKIILLIPANTTNLFNFFGAKYDLELQSPEELYAGGGKYTIRLLYGDIEIVKRYTRSGTALECQ
jgi:hypothetical protein